MVKIAGVIGLILLASFIFGVTYFLMDDVEQNYIDTGISNAPPINDSIQVDLDKGEELNQSFSPILRAFQTFGDGDDGGFTIFENIVAIPAALIALPGAFLSIAGIAVDMFTVIFRDIVVIDQQFILLGVVGIVAFIIVLIINARRS